ncbi:LPXTG cell wall anchor domain-containing protein [uncultured Enterococcus sp.]|uniref:LPXTG cell wall anchor domain-containing protein n=1 Tax=uncultured Enterococcus sp. TaxID=167972 RepID=UPI0025EE266C|nr:LPXTG cell wall anchor domain-containing protein [uncultured Enterococcus sp.]
MKYLFCIFACISSYFFSATVLAQEETTLVLHAMGESTLDEQRLITQYRVYDITDNVKSNRQYDQDRHEYLKNWAKKKGTEVEKWIQQQQILEIPLSPQQTFLLNTDEAFHAYLVLKKSQNDEQAHPIVFTTPLVDAKTGTVLNQITLFLKPELPASVETDFQHPPPDSANKINTFKRLPSTNEAKGTIAFIGAILLMLGSVLYIRKKAVRN